jgi:predicted AAA+ superfamily ATPase
MPQLMEALDQVPAICLLGPRQVGKTTLAIEIGRKRASIYLDLESESDRAKLSDPEIYLSEHADQLVILDEVQRYPNLFQSLRGLIDKGRRQGQRAGRFLLLGSAANELLQQSSESLAGRISYYELGPFEPSEVPDKTEKLWLRGGFPESFLAKDNSQSLRWRAQFMRTYLERDIPALGPRIPAETLRRFWTMLAHRQSTLLNAAELARALGIDGKTVARYLDLLVDLMLVRKLPPWHGNVGKRLVKSPKVFIRDSGLCHALLGILDRESLLSHPVVGASWESFVTEALIKTAPEGSEAHFYRTSAGAEIDLLLTYPNGLKWAVEIKRSLSPKVSKGFHLGCSDVGADKRFVVYPGQETYGISSDVEAIGPLQLCRKIESL